MVTPELVAAAWRKASYSNASGGSCVEVAGGRGWAAVRDSKNPTGPALVFAPGAFAAFVDTVKAGHLDHP